MLTFLRKIRRSLIQSGSTRKYLVYAIGEIALVIIGILIALQINNWNEGRKSEKKVRLIFAEIANDLINEIDESAQILEFYSKKDSLNRIILADKIDRKSFDQRSIFAPQFAMLNGAKISVNRRSFDNLGLIIEQVPERFDPLLKELVTLYDQDGKSVMHNYDQIQEHVVELRSYLMKNKEWYSKFLDGHLSESAISYFLTDPIYKNMLASFTKDLKDLIEGMTQYRARSIHFIRLLNEINDPPIIDMNIDSTSWMIDSKFISKHTGSYTNSKFNLEVDLEYSEYRLYILVNARRIELVPINKNLYYGVNSNDKFLFSADDAGSLVVKRSGQELVFKKIPEDK